MNRSHKQYDQGDGGFTLLESLLAIAILGIITLGVYSSILLAQHMITAARCHLEAEAIAFDHVWVLYNQDYAELWNYRGPRIQPVYADSPLSELGGTVRTAVLQHSDHCEIMVRVDWNYRILSNTNKSSSESHTLIRYPTVR